MVFLVGGGMRTLRWLGRRWWLGLIVAVMLLIAPFTVSAVTNAELIEILKVVIKGVLDAGRDAYCASGVSSLCP